MNRKKSFEEFCKKTLPDIGDTTDEEIVLELKSRYDKAVKAGFKGSYEEYLEL